MSSERQRVMFAILQRVARKNDGAAVDGSAATRLTIVVQTDARHCGGPRSQTHVVRSSILDTAVYVAQRRSLRKYGEEFVPAALQAQHPCVL